jgi:hypothetical protein
MHNEDNENGLHVSTPGSPPFSWLTFGDSMLFERDSRTTQDQVFNAIKVSVQEVYDAFKGTMTPVEKFKAWNYAPSLKSLMLPKDNHCPMFVYDDKKDIVLQRKGLDSEAAPQSPWTLEKSFESVVGSKFTFLVGDKANSYIYWGRLAWRLAPSETAKQTIAYLLRQWLVSNGISAVMIDTAYKWMGISS